MRKTLLASAILAAFMPSKTLAYNGYRDPTSAEHHYASMSHGCDLAMNDGLTRDSVGKQKAYMLLSAIGTCSNQDKLTVDACVKALPYEFDDPGQDWADVVACPLGSDIDTQSGQAFWQTIYRAYGLFAQGLAAGDESPSDVTGSPKNELNS
jgi:hypothetical protein